MNKLSPLKAIRKYCLFCMNGNSSEVKICSDKDCPLLLLRFGKGAKGVSALKAIRARCYTCGEGTPSDIKNCEITNCFLYQYRFGKNPALKGKRGKGNPEALKNHRLIQGISPKQTIVEPSAKELSPVA